MLTTAQAGYFAMFGFAAAHPGREPVIERMRNAGILDLPGAQDGW